MQRKIQRSLSKVFAARSVVALQALAAKTFESNLCRVVTSGSSVPANIVERLGSFATGCKRC